MADFTLIAAIEPEIDSSKLRDGIQTALNNINKEPVKIKVEFDQGSLNIMKGQIDKILTGMNVTKVDNKMFSGVTNGAKEATSALEGLGNAQVEVGKNSVDKSNLNSTSVMRQYSQAVIMGEKALQNWSAAQHSSNAASREAYANLEQQVYALKAVGTSSSSSLKDVSNATNIFRTSLKVNEQIIRANGDATKSLSDKLGGLATKFGAWLTVSRVIMYAVRAVRQMVRESIELDSAMTQMQIVTKSNSTEMELFGSRAASAAQRVSSAITDLVDSATVFARLGYSMNESTQLAEYTAMLQNVGDIDVSSAQNAITAIIKAYDIDASQIEGVMDKLVETGNNFPISVSQIAEGMNNASSALSAAGNSFEESVALLTAANTTIQDAAKSSTGLRTIAARIRKTKTELDDLGESMTEAEYGKIVSALTQAGVSLTTVNGEYRSTYEIMSDIAEKWSDMTSMEQAAMATALSGTRQQSVFYSIVEQFQEAKGAMDAMAGSTGALDNAYTVYLESAQAHIDRFKASFQEFSHTIVSTGLINGITDIGTAILNVTTALQKIHILIPGIIATVNLIKGIKSARALAQSTAMVNQLSKAIIMNKGVTEGLAISVSALTVAQREELRSNIEQAVAAGTLTAEQGEQIITVLGLTAANSGLIVANEGVAASFKSVMASIPVVGWIALAISVLVEVISALSVTTQSASKKAEELNSEFKTIQSSIDSHREKISDISSRYHELSMGVDNLGNNINLTSEEFKEYNDINNQIAGMFPELVKGWNKEGNAILTVKGNVEALIDALNRQQIAANATLISGGDEIVEDYQKEWRRIQEKEVPDGDIIPIKNDKGETKAVYARADAYTQLSEALKSADAASFLKEKYSGESNYKRLESLLNILDSHGVVDIKEAKGKVMDEDFFTYLTEKIAKNKTKVISAITEYESEVSTALEKTKNLANAYLQNKFLLDDEAVTGLTDSTQNLISQIINNIDSETANGFEGKASAVYNYVDDVIKAFNSLNQADILKIDAYIDMQTKFNNGEVPISKFKSSFNDINSVLNSIDDETVKKNVEIVLGVDGGSLEDILNINDLEKQITDNLGYKGTTISEAIEQARKNKKDDDISKLESYQRWIESLTKSDIEIVYDIITQTDTAEWNLKQWKERLQKEKIKLDVDIPLSDLKDKLDGYAKGVKTLEQAFGEMKDEKRISFDTLMGIQDSFSEVDGIDTYIKELSNASIATDRFNKILSELTYKKIKAQFSDKELVSSGKELVESLLKTNGVSNASAVATHLITEARQALAVETAVASSAEYDLTDKSKLTAKAIIEEAAALKLTTSEYVKILSAKKRYSDDDLDNQQKISALQQLEESLKNNGEVDAAKYLSDTISELAYIKLQEKHSDEEIVASSEEVISKYLSEIGVINSDIVAKDVLRLANAKVAAASYDVTNTANLEAGALINAANASGVTTAQFANLVAQQQVFNNSSLNVGQKISALQSLAAAAGGAANVFAGVADTIKNAGAGRFYTNNPDKVLGLLKRKWNEAMSVTSFTYSAPKINYSGSSGSSGNSGGKSGGSNSTNKAKSALEKFKDWVATLFDWIEIKLDRQLKVIEKYVSQAEELLSRNSFESAGEKYRNAISETTKQIEYESQAAAKYNAQAKNVLTQAIKKGTISAKVAQSIAKNVGSGLIQITANKEATREVIKEYQNWINKANEASKSIGDLRRKVQDYTKSLKEMRDTQRDTTINKQKNLLEVANSGYTSSSGNYYGLAQSKLNYQNDVLSSQITAYRDATTNNLNDLAAIRATSTNSNTTGAIDAQLKKSATKGEYRTALQNAKKAMQAYKKVSANDANTIKKYSLVTYERIFAYNLALDNYLLAREEQAVQFASANSEIYSNIAEKYKAKDDATNNTIDLLKQRADNTTDARKAISLLSKAANAYDAILDDDKSEINEYQNKLNTNTAIIRQAGTTHLAFNYQNLSTEGKEAVNALITRVKTCVSNGTAIASDDIKRAAEWAGKGYITERFYEACFNYNNALEHKREAEARLAIDEETAKAEKEALGTEMLSKIETEHQISLNENERSQKALENSKAYKKAIGQDLGESDYTEEVTLKQQRKEYLIKLIDALKQQTEENLNTLWGGNTSNQAYQDAISKIADFESEISDCDVSIEELKDELRDDVYWRAFERAHDAAKRLSSVLSGINDLISDNMLFNSDGDLTEFGLAKLSMLTKEYDAASKNIENYIKDIENLNALKDQYTDLEYAEKLGEFEDSLLSEASGLKSIVDNILDFYKTLEQKELDGINKVIDARKKALDAKKEYYDYDKTLKSKNKDIQFLRAQVSALEGIEDMSARAKRAQLQAQLTEAEDELNDIIQEHQFELSSKALDGLKETMQEAFDNRWEDMHTDLEAVKGLLCDANILAASQSTAIANALTDVLKLYGINEGAQKVLNSTIADEGRNDKGYAKGVKKIGKDTVAWTQDGGREFIIRKSDGALLTPLKSGDSVIPNKLTENLFAWGKISPDILSSYFNSGRPTLNIKQPNVSVDNHYDALLNIEGNVDSTVVTDVEKFAKQFYEGACEYTKREIVRDARKLGV